MRKRILFVISSVIVIIIAAILFNMVFRSLAHKKLRDRKLPLPHVASVRVVNEVWHPHLDSVGSLEAINGVTVTTEASGIIMDIGFTSGAMVEKGEYLLQIDNSLDIQNLKNNQAQLTLAQLDFNRKEKLYRSNAVSRSDYDNSLAQLRQSQAQVDKTMVQIAQKRIQAPFAGQVGISQVNIGQYLTPGSDIVTLQALDPLYVNFSLPQRYLSKIHQGQTVSLTSDTYPDKNFVGRVTAINSIISNNTRNVNIQATVNNPDLILYPGLFVDVQLHLADENSVLSLPQTAVDYSLYGDMVYLIEQQKDRDGQMITVVKQRAVKIGVRKDDKVQIISGVKAGDQVVKDGQLKLINGAQVVVDDNVNMILPPPASLEGGS